MAEFTFSETTVTTRAFVHTWKINNFKEAHPGLGGCITSQGYFNEKRVWLFCVFPDGYASDIQEYIGISASFFRHLIPTAKMPFLFTIHIVDINKIEHEVYRSERCFDPPILIQKLVKKAYVFDDKNELLQNGNLTLRFKLYFSHSKDVKSKPVQICSSISNSRISEFESIFNKEEFSDVKIVVGEKVFWAYKGVLATQSPVFEAMFGHDMKENNENIVEITDMEHEVVEEMLRFIYVGKVNNIQGIAFNLFAAADKYEIKDLKLMCEEALISKVTVKTVLSLLSLAEKYEAKLLKETAINFVKVHAKEIIQSKEWKADIVSVAPVLLEMIESLV